jgi:hypothetical protein
MMKRKTHSDRLRANLVREARAGVIPESDHIAKEIRARMNSAARLIRTLAAKGRLATLASEDRLITEILADLRHYCDFNGLVYDKLETAAADLYLAEGKLVTEGRI